MVYLNHISILPTYTHPESTVVLPWLHDVPLPLLGLRVLRHPYERIATPFQVFTWTAPLGDHTLNCVRAEETHTSRMGQDEHTAGQVKHGEMHVT